jgi:hypothetical protein
MLYKYDSFSLLNAFFPLSPQPKQPSTLTVDPGAAAEPAGDSLTFPARNFIIGILFAAFLI